jgi:hypothetical protein
MISSRKRINSVGSFWTKTGVINTIGDCLHRWGFSPQIPMRVAHLQKTEQLLEWLTITFTWIVTRALQEGAEILFGDEAGFHTQEFSQRSSSPKGQTPSVITTG